MTPWDLQKSLIAEIEELLAQMQLKNAAGEAMYVVSLFITFYDGNLNAWEWLGQQGELDSFSF